MPFSSLNFPRDLGSRGINGSLGGISGPESPSTAGGSALSKPPTNGLMEPPGVPAPLEQAPLCQSPRRNYSPFLPGDESLALKKGPFSGLAPAGKFRSGIRLLQVSTGKPTTTREHSCQFGETSYSVCFVFGVPTVCGTNLGIGPGGRSVDPHPASSALRRASAVLTLFVRDL